MTTTERLLAETTRAQVAASDPAVSAWVSANAGAGKTHVLKMRVLRLLLEADKPDSIMCLTYTKAAAAEMSTRIFEELAEWATAPEQRLGELLHKALGRRPDEAERLRARRLFAAAIETPGGFKVQTIHAFCERLLQRFPLEAGVPPGFRIIDDELAATLRNETIEAMLLAATRQPSSPLGRALQVAVGFAASDHFEQLIGEAIGKTQWLLEMGRLDVRGGSHLANAEELYRTLLGLSRGDTAAALDAALAATIADAELIRLREVLGTGSSKDLDAARHVQAVLDAPSPATRADAVAQLLLTGDKPRDNVMTKKLARAHPDLAMVLERAGSRALELNRRRKAATVLSATMALLRLAEDVLQRFGAAKSQRAALDFDDLIAATTRLLGQADAAPWVLYKLDGGLRHILVDEAQDTSPRQWSIVEALAAEFYAGSGAGEGIRTLFAVGDEKQSIYSFQGAAPKMFAATGARFEMACRNGGLAWRRVPLQLSFRTVAPLLEAVDRVFDDPMRGRGVLSATNELRHIALRQGHAGLMEMWAVERPSVDAGADPWMPHGDQEEAPPAMRVADRIADTIQSWLANGERLESEDRPLHAGDILILVRNRRPFAPAMVAALKARGIPVAGADRMNLTDQIAVKDLVALGDFLTLPEDDLALASVLKSPMFDLDDDDLLAIAPERKGALWGALLDRAKTDDRFKPAAGLLRRWRSDADYLPPFEFFAGVLDSDGMRARFLRRLGPDAADPLDELIARAIAYDEQSPPSMLGFLTWLRTGPHVIKRDMEQTRHEVRVMTVHGAKGLEAPIVFLPDTCSAPSGNGGARSPLVALGEPGRLPHNVAPPLAWSVKGTGAVQAVAAGRAAIRDAEADEHRRLLYVALTRARDRLYIAGFTGKKAQPQDCWYEIIRQGMGDLLVPNGDANGAVVHRYATPQTAAPETRKTDERDTSTPVKLPQWATRPAPREASLVMPIAPSRLAPLDTDDAGEPVETASTERASLSVDDVGTPSPLTLAGDHRFLRGTLTHALLQHLPTLPPATWNRAAGRYLDVRARVLAPATRAGIVRETMAVLNDPAFAPVFGPNSQAEVPIVGEIAPPTGRGPKLRISGQIDRLVCTDEEVLIIDYKTNRPPPLELAGVPVAYLYQMASYRLVLAAIYPGRQIRAAIIWTDGGRLMPIPDAILDDAAARLWSLDRGQLDG